MWQISKSNDEKKVISVIGYKSCGYYPLLAMLQINGKKNNIRVVCKAWDRAVQVAIATAK